MDHLLVTIIALSVIFQFIAGYLAIRLIRFSNGARTAWMLLSGAFLLQGLRRLVDLIETTNGAVQRDLFDEILGLLISLVILAGVSLIAPIFTKIKQTNDALVAKQEELARSNEQLAESETRFRTVAEFTADWEFWIDTAGNMKYTSPSCQELSGYTRQDFYDDPKLVHKIIHPEDVPLYQDHLNNLLEDGSRKPIDYRIITRSGEVRWVAHVCRPVLDTDGSPLGWRASNRDISKRKQIEQMLHEYTVTLEREVDERKRTQEALADKRLELETLNRTLERRVDDAVGELRNKDQLMISQSRLAAMGEMISFIAHQWRSPLNNLGLVMQSVRQEYDAGRLTPEQMGQYLGKGMNLINFMSQTIDDFRYFFRSDKTKQLFSVRESVSRAISLVQASLKDNDITIVVEAEEDLQVEGYPNEYAQALLNLLGNARDALLEQRVAEPLIRVRMFAEGERAVLTINDNAGGIPEIIIDRVFDPYFTTKEESKGSGIGLFMARTIIEKNMGGRLSVRNVESGAEFRVEVPAVKKSIQPPSRPT